MMTLESKLQDLQKHFDDGSLPALFEAIQWCHANSVALPEWAAVGACNAVIEVYNRRSGRVRDYYADFVRWRAVRHLLDARGLEGLPSAKGRPRKDSETPTKNGILNAALNFLQAQPNRNRLARYPSDIGAVEHSFREVERSLANGDARYRFDDLMTFP